MAVATLAKFACLGGGPPFHKAGRIPLYPVELLDKWALARLGPVVLSTSEDGHAEASLRRGLAIASTNVTAE